MAAHRQRCKVSRLWLCRGGMVALSQRGRQERAQRHCPLCPRARRRMRRRLDWSGRPARAEGNPPWRSPADRLARRPACPDPPPRAPRAC
eukprot:2620990-Pyramimonas_sp.AAC.1